jgi:hypothetical protein
MIKAVAINGSPLKQNGKTAMLLSPLIKGMTDAGACVELFYARDLKVKSCRCHDMYCWTKKPAECCIKDDMELLYPKLREAEILVLATPVYIPLPGERQSIINRLCPLINPVLETRQGRTRARFHDNVNIQKILLVSTSGWWEKGNFDTVIRIAREIAEDASVEFAGVVIRPHSSLMKRNGRITENGGAVLAAAEKAGGELMRKGAISPETLEAISSPLISEDEYMGRQNG